MQVRTNIRDITGQDSKAPSTSTPIPCPHCGKPGIKPSTVLYGRALPGQFNKCKKSDFAANTVDLFFVMGSSLTVQPACLLPNEAGMSCHRVLVNRDGAGNLDLFGRQRHRMTVESTTAPVANSMQEAVNTAMKAQLHSMLDKFTEWQNELKQSEALIARTNATIDQARKTATEAKSVQTIYSKRYHSAGSNNR